tara:strand:- start:1770 stop:2162 length:393 start_codon:yes stop_codon:yes gene_type:complete
MNEEELLDMAMGGEVPEAIQFKQYWEQVINDPKERLVFRREARRAVYDYRKFARDNIPYTNKRGLYFVDTYILPEMQPNLGVTLASFTNNWDLEPLHVTRIVRKEKWAVVGGRWDENTGACVPSAFTQQE